MLVLRKTLSLKSGIEELKQREIEMKVLKDENMLNANLISEEHRYRSDTTIQYYNNRIAEIYGQAAPVSIIRKDTGDTEFVFSAEVEKLVEELRQLKQDYISKNYSQIMLSYSPGD